MSRDNTVSCATCHQPKQSYADGKRVAQGIGQQQGTRNTASLLTAGYTKAKFWDGRRASLTEQVLDPYVNIKEHGLKDLAKALAAFITQLQPKQTRLTRYFAGNNKAAFSAAQQHGLELFMGRAQCGQCHIVNKENTVLTDGGYHIRGVGMDKITRKLAKLSKSLIAMTPLERA